jgi:hypothetical protein
VSTILRLRQGWKTATPADKLAFRRSLASWTVWLCLSTANRLLLIKIANVIFRKSQRRIQLSLGGSLACDGAQEFFVFACHLLDDVVVKVIRDAMPREALREALGSGITLFCAVIISAVRWEVTVAYVVLNSIVKKITAPQEDIQEGFLQAGSYAILGVIYPGLI